MSQHGRITKAHKHTLPPCVSRQSQNPALNCAFKVSQNGKIAAWIRRLRIIWFWRACYQALLHWKCLQNAQLLQQGHLFQMPANELHDHTRRRKEISWIFQNIAISIYKDHIHLSSVIVNKNKLAKARKTRTSPGTLGLKKFGLSKLGVKTSFSEDTLSKNTLSEKNTFGK